MSHVEQLAPDSKLEIIEKSSLEKLQDNLRSRYACAFAAEQKMSPHHDPGSLLSGYIKNKDGIYETHSNGLARRFSVLGCRKGLVVWISESRDLLTYTVEIKSLLGDTLHSFVYLIDELNALLSKHLHEADRAHAINHFKNEIDSLPRSSLVNEYKALKKKLGTNERDPSDLETTRLTILEVGLSDQLEALIEEAFVDKAEIGRKAYLYIARLEAEKGIISWPVYITICCCIHYTLPTTVKRLLLKAIALDTKLKPSDPDYRVWLEQTAELASFLIELADSRQKKIGESNRKTHRLVTLSSKRIS
jgi:hypothetical protein